MLFYVEVTQYQTAKVRHHCLKGDSSEVKLTTDFCSNFVHIPVPRAYDPSGLRQESIALGATILK